MIRLAKCRVEKIQPQKAQEAQNQRAHLPAASRCSFLCLLSVLWLSIFFASAFASFALSRLVYVPIIAQP